MKVVIAGAGFGGLKMARKLNNRKGIDVLLIDRFNFHQFQPLFYQVATAGLDASNISFPLRKIFHKSRNVRIRLADIYKIEPGQNKLATSAGDISYDVLVLATGADTNFFGNEHIAGHAFPMKSTLDALQLRRGLLLNFERALEETKPEELQRRMNIVVVGGGPTGVEVSGALAEMKINVLPKDYPELDFKKMNIFLLEGSKETLAAMSDRSSEDSCKYLERLGVTVMKQTVVKDYDGENVQLQNGSTIPAKTVIWAAGIKGNVPDGVDNTLVVKGNRIKVDRYCRILNQTNIYAIGDVAYMESPKFPKGQPQVAPTAMQQGAFLAKNLIRMQKGRTDLEEFEYFDKGSMATVGRNLAVVDLPKPRLHFSGFFAWLIWMVLHLFMILGVKNRFFVFVNWLYNYFTYDQSLRLIFGKYKDKPDER
jgi:NADH dehydrogenase